MTIVIFIYKIAYYLWLTFVAYSSRCLLLPLPIAPVAYRFRCPRYLKPPLPIPPTPLLSIAPLLPQLTMAPVDYRHPIAPPTAYHTCCLLLPMPILLLPLPFSPAAYHSCCLSLPLPIAPAAYSSRCL